MTLDQVFLLPLVANGGYGSSFGGSDDTGGNNNPNVPLVSTPDAVWLDQELVQYE
jgi:hypothetical protein